MRKKDSISARFGVSEFARKRKRATLDGSSARPAANALLIDLPTRLGLLAQEGADNATAISQREGEGEEDTGSTLTRGYPLRDGKGGEAQKLAGHKLPRMRPLFFRPVITIDSGACQNKIYIANVSSGPLTDRPPPIERCSCLLHWQTGKRERLCEAEGKP